MILQAAKGIPAWRTPKIVPLIVTTGLAEGGGLFLAIAAQFPAPRSVVEVAAVAAVTLAALRGWVWRSYLATLTAEGAPAKTLSAYRLLRPWMFVLGLALPMILTIVGFASPTLGGTMFVLGGLSIAAAGMLLKLIIVTVAAFNQGFAIAHTPVRGSGRAGGAAKPGWSAT
jgi:phenylacetyl-CoA:acceptor oxidoreductase subunit 2